MKRDLSSHVVGNLPTVMYIPCFVSEKEEAHLIKKIYEAPVCKWKTLSNRRLQNWGGIVHENGLLQQDLPHWLANITKRMCEETMQFSSTINHVLVNEYLPNQGIMQHQDGPAYFPVVAILSLGSPVVMDFTPHSRLRIENGNNSCWHQKAEKWAGNHHPFSVLLLPQSLMIFKDDAYSNYLHGIQDCDVQLCDEAINVQFLPNTHCDQLILNSELDSKAYKLVHRTTNRISLTCRQVMKVHRAFFSL